MQYRQDRLTPRQLTAKANAILDRRGMHNRLQLTLALVVAVGLGLSIWIILDCLALAGAILGGRVMVWLEVVYQVLFYGSFVFVFLPLLSGVYRMAILMVQTNEILCPDTLMPPQVGLFEVLYAFTSPKAYARSLLTGLQVSLRWGGVCLFPAAFLGLSDIWMPTLIDLTGAPLFLTLGHWGVALILGLGWYCLACLHHGYAYLWLAHPECSLSQIKHKYKAAKHPVGYAFCAAWHGTWRILVATLLVLVPLFLHTLPNLFLNWALQGQYMFDKIEKQEEN